MTTYYGIYKCAVVNDAVTNISPLVSQITALNGYTQQVKKNCATIHSFITLTNVNRFSKFFHHCILQEICNKAHKLNY